jgi:hypothetical protein
MSRSRRAIVLWRWKEGRASEYDAPTNGPWEEKPERHRLIVQPACRLTRLMNPWNAWMVTVSGEWTSFSALSRGRRRRH